MIDINEFTPVFSMSVYNESVLSITPVGEPLFRVMATDGDGEDNIISYSITDQVSPDFNFSVDSNGVIVSNLRFPPVVMLLI